MTKRMLERIRNRIYTRAEIVSILGVHDKYIQNLITTSIVFPSIFKSIVNAGPDLFSLQDLYVIDLYRYSTDIGFTPCQSRKFVDAIKQKGLDDLSSAHFIAFLMQPNQCESRCVMTVSLQACSTFLPESTFILNAKELFGSINQRIHAMLSSNSLEKREGSVEEIWESLYRNTKRGKKTCADDVPLGGKAKHRKNFQKYWPIPEHG